MDKLRARYAQLHPGQPVWSDAAIEAYRLNSRNVLHRFTDKLANKDFTEQYSEFLARCGGISWQGIDNSTFQVFGLGLYESDVFELAVSEFERHRVFPQIALPIARFYGPTFDLCGWHFTIINKFGFRVGEVVELVYAAENDTTESLAQRLRASYREETRIRLVASTVIDWLRVMLASDFSFGRR
jgi:hypothetical protein